MDGGFWSVLLLRTVAFLDGLLPSAVDTTLGYMEVWVERVHSFVISLLHGLKWLIVTPKLIVVHDIVRSTATNAVRNDETFEVHSVIWTS